MVALTDLWLPILLSAVLVFVASSLIHMVIGWHAADWRKLAAEDSVLDALRALQLAPGDYAAPLAPSMAEMNTDEFKAKVARGPRVVLTIIHPGQSIPRSLALWFLYSLVIGLFAAYVAGITLGAGAQYLTVFRVTATIAFAGYALALWQSLIWYSRGLGYTLRTTVDGIVYALLTGGIFGWLWP